MPTVSSPKKRSKAMSANELMALKRKMLENDPEYRAQVEAVDADRARSSRGKS